MFLGKAKAAVATRKMYAKVVALFVRIVVPSIGRGGKQRERMLCDAVRAELRTSN